MKRLVAGFAVLLLGTAVVAVAEEAAAGSANGKPPSAEVIDAVCSAPNSTEALLAAGFTILEGSTERGIPNCPSVSGCGGVNVVCRAQNCGATDLGRPNCKQSDGTVLHCTRGTTVHVNNCGCEEIFRANCCSQSPACLCAGCSNSSSFLSCQ